MSATDTTLPALAEAPPPPALPAPAAPLAANWEAAHRTLAFGASPLEIPAVSSGLASAHRFVNSRESLLASFLVFLFAAWVCFAAWDTTRGMFIYLALCALWIGGFRTVAAYGDHKGLHVPARRARPLGEALFILAALPPIVAFLIRP